MRDRSAQFIVVDGGSYEGPAALAAGHADMVLAAPPGCARQINAGAARANGDMVLFLHADTRLPEQADALAGLLAQPLPSRRHR